MIGVFDVETTPIRAGEKPKFILGVLLLEGKKTSETFYSASDMWKRILEIGEAEWKRKKTFTLYGHNVAFDFFQVADLNDTNLKYFCYSPFITSYNKYGSEMIKFLDTMSLFRMSLAKLALLIGMEKWETPLELLDKKEHDFLELEQIRSYCEQDCKITLKAVLDLKTKLKCEGIVVRRLYTINQVAINYLINTLRKKDNKHILLNPKEGRVHATFRKQEILESYRGGRNEAFQIGSFKGVNYLDINSLYPFCLANIKFPNLRSERKIWNPLDFMKQEDLLSMIGISKVLIKNNNDDIGLLAVRTSVGNYYPKRGKYLYGSWTHLELAEAVRNGYEILRIEYSVLWDEASNPFKEEMYKLYDLRKKGEFESYFYKQMMNSGIGKMAQHRNNMEIEIIDVEKAEEYLKKNFDIVGSSGMNYVVEKKPLDTPTKKYFMSIIPTLVNAMARVIIYDAYKKVGLKDLIYSDTDSIMFMGDHFNKFKISDKLGDWKIVVKDGFHKNYGKKTYRINDDVHVGGIFKRGISTEMFDEGIVLNTRMKTISTSTNLDEVGSFTTEKEDLNNRRTNLEGVEQLFHEQDFFIDESTEVNQETISVLRGLL